MSVRKAERRQSKLEVQNVAEEICKYTLQKIGNQKVIPKRDYRLVGEPMFHQAFSMYTHIIQANEFDLFNAEEAAQRLILQKKAIGELLSLMALVDIVASLKGNDKSYQHWAELVLGERELINGWIKSDKRRQFASKT